AAASYTLARLAEASESARAAVPIEAKQDRTRVAKVAWARSTVAAPRWTDRFRSAVELGAEKIYILSGSLSLWGPPWGAPGIADGLTPQRPNVGRYVTFPASSRLRAQREALAHQVLRDLPQKLGVLWVQGVRLDAVEGVGGVVHRGDVTVLEIETAAPLELRGGRGEHRGRGPGLDGLELHPAGASLEELQVLRLQVSAELGHDA